MTTGNKSYEVRHPHAACLLEEYVCQRIQSLGYTADLNSDEVNQLTDSNVVEVVNGDPNVTLTIDINDFGSINTINQLGGYFLYPTHLYDNTNSAAGFVGNTDMETNTIDVLVAIDEHAADVQSRALWFNNCSIESVSGTYQVDGFASESYNLACSEQTWFLNALAGVRVAIPTYVGASELDVTHSGADGSAVIVTEDGVRLSDSYWDTNANGNIIAQGGYAFNSGKRYRYVWDPNTNAFPSITQDPTSPVGGLKENEIEIQLWNADEYGTPTVATASRRTLRVQSVDYELSFDREDLKQLYNGTYYKGLNDTNVTATVTVNDSDLELWAMTSGNAADFSSSDLTSISLSNFQSTNSIGMRIAMYNTSDYLLHSTDTLLKYILLTNGKVTSVGDSFDVPGRGTQTMEITFTTIAWYGSGKAGR